MYIKYTIGCKTFMKLDDEMNSGTGYETKYLTQVS